MITNCSPLLTTAAYPPRRFFRFDIQGHRHYYNPETDSLHKSLTTTIDAIMAPSRHLVSWREGLVGAVGKQGLDEIMEQLADYGTRAHTWVARFLLEGKINWAEVKKETYDAIIEAGFPKRVAEVAGAEMQEDVASYLQFLEDYRVVVLAVEVPVWYRKFATLIDLIVEMDATAYGSEIPPDKRKRHRAIINIKTGKKGFHETHELQLIGEMMAHNHVYPGQQIGKIYNLAPGAFKGKPTYKLQDWASKPGGMTPAVLDKMLDLGELRGIFDPPKGVFRTFTGTTNYGQPVTDAVVAEPYMEYIRNLVSSYTPEIDLP